MRIRLFVLWILLLLGSHARAQFVLDCACIAQQPGMTVTNCQATIPDLCALTTNCFRSSIQPPPPLIIVQCSQTPPAGTPVGPGTHPITVTVTVAGMAPIQCLVPFVVVAPNPGPFGLQCAPAKTVTCGAAWTFDPPTVLNPCCPNPALPNGGTTVSVVSTVTNGLCPLVVTRTWQAVDNCGQAATCSQTVTVAGGQGSLTLNCAALAAWPDLQTNACAGYVPALCAQAIALAQQSCPCTVNCTQSIPAGTAYSPGTYPITVTLSDGSGGTATCTVNFVVTAPPGGCNPCPPTLSAVLNTGTTNGSGGLLPTGAFEQVWINVAAPGGTTPMVVADTNLWPIAFGPWLPPTAVSAWVSPSVGMQAPAGLYTNRVVFDAKCDRVCLTGRVASDDDGYLYVNGVLVVASSGFTFWTNVNHCADFVAGANVIEFVVNNAGGPTGFRTELEFYESCCCNTFTNVWNSGMDGTNLLAMGQPDLNYQLVSAPPGACNGPAQVLDPTSLPVGPWVANSSTSQWIGAGPTAYCQEGVYHYRLCFYVPCADSASIIGRWAADDNAAIHLNGLPTGDSIPSLQYPNLPGYGWFPVSITNGFICGTNCLDFYVTNANIGINPTGFRAELTNVFDDCCCGPLTEVSSYHSGADASGLLPANAPDPQLVLTCAPPGVPTGPALVVPFPNGLWVPNGPNSQWVAASGAPFNTPGGTYCYNYRFTLPPCTNGTPNYAVKGQWMGDDAGTIYVNGNPSGNNLPNGWAFTNWHPISITSGLVPGVNTLTFYITNASAGDTGLRVELTNYASCCDCVMTNCDIAIKCPPDLDLEACAVVGNTAVVTYPLPTASSTCGTIVSIVCTPPSGSPFPLGITTVNCTATDANGHTASCSFRVRVRRDTTPPNCPPFNMTVTGCPPLMPDFSTNALITDNCSTLAQITVTQSIPPGTPLPAGPTVVILNLCDAAGNCRVCDVVVTAHPSGNPPVIKCPPNQTLLTCSNSAKAYFKASATGNNGPIVCVPPSGSNFPIGTNTVTCTATNNCGWKVSCSFTVVVKPYGPLSPFPSATYWAGTPDNYAGATEPASVSACLNTAFSPVPFRSFDQIGNNRILGHRFTGLPNNIVKAVLVVRMKPSLTDPNSNNDGLFLGFGPVCTSSTYVHGNAIRLLPGAVPATGGTWVAGSNGSTTFTLNLGTLDPALISKMNTEGFLDVAIHDDTVVDYMQLRIWRCPPPHIGIGTPHSTGTFTNPASTLAAMASKVLPGFGPIGVGPSICIFPPHTGVNKVSEVEVDLGGGTSYSFTTVLDMNAPDGATMEIVDPQDPMGVPLLTLTLSRRTGCWDLKKCKGGISDRVGFNSTAVNDQGELLGSSFQTLNEGNDNPALILRPEDDSITQFPVTLTFNRVDGSISVTFPGSTERGKGGRKGWDGTIKGRPPEAARKGWDGTIKGRPPGASIVTFTPNVPHPVVAPQLVIYGTGMDEWLLTSEVLTTMRGGVKVELGLDNGDGSGAAAAWFQSTAANDGVSVVSLADGGGVSLDLGHSASVDLRTLMEHQGETNPDSAFRLIGGPIRGLTNRPPPPVFDLRFVGYSNDVACAVDFTPLKATSVRVELWDNGVLVAAGVNPGPVITVEDELLIGRRPDRITVDSVLGGLRAYASGKFALEVDNNGNLVVIQCDELRLIPEVAASPDLPQYIAGLVYAGSEGSETLLYDVQRTPYCGDSNHLRIEKRPDGIVTEWDSVLDDAVRLQGAEDVTGPWFELGVKSPYAVGTDAPAKFFRLICD